MAPSDLPLDLLTQIRSAELRRYARATGWQRNEAVNGKVAVFQHPASDLDQPVVPVEGGDPDGYAVLAREAVRKLAGWEKRPPAEVLNDLLLPPADVLRFRTASQEAAAGSLPLEQTVQQLNGIRRLLSAAAHSALAPQRYYPRLRRAEAEEFVGRCHVGQTERGSFTLAVACPLDLPPAGTRLFEDPPVEPPFPRRATQLLMRSLGALAEAVDYNRVDGLADLGRNPGLSANFCEALLLLRPTGERSFLGVSSSWSRVLPVDPAGPRPRAEVELRQEAFEAAEYLSPVLRAGSPAREDSYFGFVDELRGGPTPAGERPSGEVSLSLYEDGAFFKARAYLTADQYAVANAAHMAAKPVELEGVVRRLPRGRLVERITTFGLLRSSPGPNPGPGAAGGPS